MDRLVAVDDEVLDASSNSSSTSGESTDCEIPSSLETEELQLALNKEATEEELIKAISRCKNLALNADNCSTERKWLVRHLIELRLRLQECKEAALDSNHPRNKSSGISKRTIKGHHLVLQPLLRSSRYCDYCTSGIWCLVQAWYECSDCGYSCHYKCMSAIPRECAHVVASENGEFERAICPEVGLSAQRYRCAECKSLLEMKKSFNNNNNEARRCDYNGRYYCPDCHWGGMAVIPSRVVNNWDFNPRPVCQASLQLLRVAANRPIINIESINPRLYAFVDELKLVKKLRVDLRGMRKYLTVCRAAQKDSALQKCVDEPHLIETAETFSLQDLMGIRSGVLISKLQRWTELFENHIREQCEICRGRGHICEICKNEEILFPFELETAVLCGQCRGVFHKACFGRKKECPRCVRLMLREEQQQKLADQDDPLSN